MAIGEDGGWLRLCRDAGLEPAEVQRVLSHYRAYRTYTVQQRGEPLPLPAWFRFYRMEVASEGGQQAPAPSGCSVDDDARNRGALGKPREFLDALQALHGTGDVS
jgi:hypothetical protein